MSRSHWLDPLARRVLQAAGQLPRRTVQSSAAVQPPAWSFDVNRATTEDWCKLPGCSDDMADLLIRLQQGGVQFSGAEDLFQVLDLPNQLHSLWRPHLLFQWHGDAPLQPKRPPIDLNNARVDQLELLHWPEQRLKGLLAERRRCGFRDLADLQSRLCLPASTIEALIGRVCFEPRRANPSLPLGSKRNAA